MSSHWEPAFAMLQPPVHDELSEGLCELLGWHPEAIRVACFRLCGGTLDVSGDDSTHCVAWHYIIVASCSKVRVCLPVGASSSKGALVHLAGCGSQLEGNLTASVGSLKHGISLVLLKGEWRLVVVEGVID